MSCLGWSSPSTAPSRSNDPGLGPALPREVALGGGMGVPSLCSVRSVEMGNQQLSPKGSTLGYAGRVPSPVPSLRSLLPCPSL